jgi:hypothetical protein
LKLTIFQDNSRAYALSRRVRALFCAPPRAYKTAFLLPSNHQTIDKIEKKQLHQKELQAKKSSFFEKK